MIGLVVEGGAAVIGCSVSVAELLWRGLIALGRGVGGGVGSASCVGGLWLAVVALSWPLVSEAKTSGSVLTAYGAYSGSEES